MCNATVKGSSNDTLYPVLLTGPKDYQNRHNYPLIFLHVFKLSGLLWKHPSVLRMPVTAEHKFIISVWTTFSLISLSYNIQLLQKFYVCHKQCADQNSFTNCSYHTIPNCFEKSEAECDVCHMKVFLCSYSYCLNILCAVLQYFEA